MSLVLHVADLASEQWGLFTTAQAAHVGASPQALARLTHNGTIERIAHGVYRLTGSSPDPLDDLRAAWLALQPQTRAALRIRSDQPFAVSHRSAAMVHGLGDLDTDEHEFTAPVRKQSRRAGTRTHRRTLDHGDWTIVDSLPVTTIPRTIADLAAERTDGGHLAAVVRDALVVKQVDEARLVAALRPYAHHYGVRAGNGAALLTRFLQEAGVSESVERAAMLAQREDPSASFEDVPLATQIAGLQRTMSAWAQTLRLANDTYTMRSKAQPHEALSSPPQFQALADLVAQVNQSGSFEALRNSTAAIQDSPAARAAFEAMRDQADTVKQPPKSPHRRATNRGPSSASPARPTDVAEAGEISSRDAPGGVPNDE